MSKALMRRTEIWRADTDAEAAQIVDDAENSGGELTKKTIEIKQRKSKGEVVDESRKITVQIDYCGQWDTLEDE